LNFLIKDKNRIRSFIYRIIKDQSQSYEVVHAKKISEIYGTKWEQIELGSFYKYSDSWFDIYGISTHLHGMYHIDFYSKIFQKNSFNDPTFLSGIIGDAWSEYNKFKEINKKEDLVNLGYTHGLNLNLKYLNIKHQNELKNKFYQEHHHFLKNDKLKSVFA